MPKREEIIVGLDVGTAKVCAIVGEVTPQGDIDVIGVGSTPSRGLRKGVVVDIERTVHAMNKVIEEAELMAGCSIHEVYVGISGSHVQGFNSSGVVALKDREVRQQDIVRVLDGARAVPMAQDREVIHVLPQQYVIDEQDGISKPLGMSGVRMESKVHIVTGAIPCVQNITKCTEQTGLRISDLILNSIASAEAVLNEDEQELGVALVDIGAGTTDLAIFESGSVVHTAVLPVGGDHITNDIAVGMRTPMPEAERIKIKYGCAKSSLIRKDESIQVPGVGGRAPKALSRQLLSEIIEPRLEEIFELVQQELRSSGYEDLLASGLVVTGGTTDIEGIVEFAEEVTGLPVRRGTPQGIGGLTDVVRSPIYATAVGLLLYSRRQVQQQELFREPTHGLSRRWRRFRGWLSAFFY